MNMRSSTLSTTNYRVVIKAPSTGATLTTLTVSNTPAGSKDPGGATIPSLVQLWMGKDSKPNMDSEDEEGDFEICISDNSRFGVGGGAVAFDMTEYDTDSPHPSATGGGGAAMPIQKKHINPLLKAVTIAKEKSARIVKEMDYMHRREFRMHKTSTSTNRRLFWFGAMSVGALVGVAGFQVVYLRGYFRRKKLL